MLDGGVKLTWMPPCTCTALMPVGAPGGVASTSNGSLRPPVSASPLVRLALSSAPICAVSTVAPVTVQVFVPAAIVHVVVPPSAPGPTRPSAIAVLALTGAGVSPTSRLSTTTLNAVPTATELPLLTLVMASRAAGPTTRTLDGNGRVPIVPSPSSPSLFSPQHSTPTLVTIAQVWFCPAAIAVTPLVRPVTSTGVRRCVVVPSPSCPLVLRPQHLTPPAVVSAQVCERPAVTAAMPLVRPVTTTGASRCETVPSPSCPFRFSPQHFTAPPATAHVCLSPAATLVAPLVRPETSTGVSLCVCVPSPTCPLVFNPQHLTPPPLVSAHV